MNSCAECKDGLPSVNWKYGKPYSYCPECGRDDRPDAIAEIIEPADDSKIEAD